MSLPQPKPKPQPNLYSLPAELRNIIYAYILADTSTNPTSSQQPYSLTHHPHHTTFHPLSHPTRPYLALTRISRLFRLEFTPLYFPLFPKPTISFAHATTYLSAFPLPDKHASKSVEKVFCTLCKCVKPIDTSIIQILPLLAEYDELPFRLAEDSGLARSHGRRGLAEVVVWLARSSILPGEVFSNVCISQKDVKNRMAPVLHLVFREGLEEKRVSRVLGEVVWRARGWRTLRIEGKDGVGRRFSWTPGERYVRY